MRKIQEIFGKSQIKNDIFYYIIICGRRKCFAQYICLPAPLSEVSGSPEVFAEYFRTIIHC